jgi:hypothetical protein
MAIDTDACTSTQVDDRHMHVPIRCPSCSHSAAISTTTRTRTALSAPTSTGVRQCQRAPDRRADTHASIVNAQYDHNLPPYNNHLVVNQTRHTLISIFLLPLLSIFLNVCSATPIDNSLIDARITQGAWARRPFRHAHRVCKCVFYRSCVDYRRQWQYW